MHYYISIYAKTKQSAPIHDHDGMWCVEGVWHGALEIVRYERLDHLDSMRRFQPVGSILARNDSVGSLIPPVEYHSICNPDENGGDGSIHIYAIDRTECVVIQAAEFEYCHKLSARSFRM